MDCWGLILGHLCLRVHKTVLAQTEFFPFGQKFLKVGDVVLKDLLRGGSLGGVNIESLSDEIELSFGETFGGVSEIEVGVFVVFEESFGTSVKGKDPAVHVSKYKGTYM